MNDKSETSEPSIEEILASIRKIINEDETADGALAEAAGAPTSDADGGATTIAAPVAAETATDSEDADADADDDDVLELTDMVEPPDQSAAVMDAPDVAEETTGTATPDADAEAFESAEAETDPAFAEAAPEPRAAEDVTIDLDGDEDALTFDAEDTEEPDTAVATEGAPDEPSESAPTEPEPTPPEEEPAAAVREPALAPQPEPLEASSPVTATPVLAGAAGGLISDAVAQAARGAMAKLNRSASSRGGSIGSLYVSDKSLEDIVREMLRPMLQEWLDTHLPPLVERLVERELEKIGRQAEDL